MKKNKFNPLVSIIIPCYNGEKYLSETIASALNQTYKPIEVIFIDDCSKDRSLQIARTYKNKIKIMTCNKNSGPSYARNMGLKEARGEYIQFLDSDDIIREDKIEKQIEFFKDNPEYDLVFSEVTSFSENIEENKPEIWREHKARNDYLEAFLIVCIMSPHSPLIKKITLDNIKGFKTEFIGVEDWDLWIRLCLRDVKIKFMPGILAFYRNHPASLSSKNILLHRRREKELLLKFVDYLYEIKNINPRYWHILSYSLARESLHLAELKDIKSAIELFNISNKIRPEITYDIDNISVSDNGTSLSTLYLHLFARALILNVHYAEDLNSISKLYYKYRSEPLTPGEACSRADALFQEAIFYYRSNKTRLGDERYQDGLELVKFAQNSGEAGKFWRSYAIIQKEKNMLEKNPDIIKKAIEECPDSFNTILLLNEINMLDKYPDILARSIEDFPHSRKILSIRAKYNLKKGCVYKSLRDFLLLIFETFNRM